MMTRTVLVGLALLISAALVEPARAVDPQGRAEAAAEAGADQQLGVRQREGGQAAGPEAERGAGREGVRQREGGEATARGVERGRQQEGTEEGLPEVRAEFFDRGGRFRPETRWRLGVYARDTSTGVVVTRVIPGSAAWGRGLESGDRIVAVGGFQVGIVGGRVYYLGEELQHRADSRGRVLLLLQNVRDNGLLNVDVSLDPSRPEGPRIPMPRWPRGGIAPEREGE